MVSSAKVDTTTGDSGDGNLEDRLLLACKAGQLQVVVSLLESGRAWPDGEGWTPLTSVDVEGNSGDWHFWRQRACDIDPTPLHLAASGGHAGIVKALLAAGARRNPRASMARCFTLPPVQQPHALTHQEAAGGVTPLHLAAHQGWAEVITALVEAGANVNILGGALAEPPLHLAAKCGHTAAMLALLRKGADVNAGNCRNQTALHGARSAPALDLLLAAGADKSGQVTNCAEPLRLSDTPLGALVVTTDVRLTSEREAKEATTLVEVLLSHGAHASVPLAPHHQQGLLDSLKFEGVTTPEERSPCQAFYPVVPSASTASDWSPETSAGTSESLSETDIAEEDPQQARIRCCSISSESSESIWTPKSMWVGPPSSPRSLLPRAAKNGVPGIVAALLRAGLDPTEQDEHRMTPLHYAAEEGHPEVLRLLLRAGAEVDSATPRERRTPLHIACRCARLDCVLELLRWGASLNSLCVLSEDDFGLESGDDDFYRTPLQVVGWADSSSANNNQREAEERHNAIRRALVREDRWRRRGWLVVLRCLLKKDNPRDDAATPDNAAAAPTPLSRKHSSSDGASIIPLAEYRLDSGRVGAPWSKQAAKRGGPVTSRSDTEESVGGEEGGKRRQGGLVSAMVEEEDSRSEAGDKAMRALAGLMRLGGVKESLFRKVVGYL